METFNFKRSEQVKVWVNRIIKVKADTLEQAQAIASQQFPGGEDDVEWGKTDVLWETEEVLALQVCLEDEDVDDKPIIRF